ncbi:hypothetical protein VUR80DRAFT_1367 [Thermomyces stellatus]
MTEPENFEDDLFADLYNDDEAPKPAPQPAQKPAASDAPVDDTSTTAAETNGQEDDYQPADQDDDDNDVDFDLGDAQQPGPSSAPAAQRDVPGSPPPPVAGSTAKAPGSSKEDGKMFIGGLNWETTDQSLRDYFSQFGEVLECTVMRDNNTGRSRGFGFLTFKDPKTVNIVMVKEHFLDGKIIDPKRAIPRDEQEKTSKIFVGGVSQETTDQEFREYFQQFGRVVDATLMMDKDTGRPRGFGFVTFESEAGVDACINTPLEIHGKPIEVKKAQPRGNMREEEEAARRGKFRKEDGTVGAQQGGGGAGAQANAGGMSPQVMAQYMQRMQQYFQAMQQQQLAMSRGMGAMNPMMQQMMMAQMQQQMMGRGGGGGQGPNPAMMNNMNPAMMQQMMAGMGNQGNMPQGQGGRGFGGNFDQQMPDQPPAPAQPRRGRDNQYGQGYGMGGAPTSWEGMYDDVPQPNAPAGGGRGGGFHKRGGNQDPANAPPANAPTGPRNAGRPGANYRGGGRGGNRGFHPYARG